MHFLHLVKQVGHSEQLHAVHAQAQPHMDPLFYSLRSRPRCAEERMAKLPMLQQTSSALPTRHLARPLPSAMARALPLLLQAGLGRRAGPAAPAPLCTTSWGQTRLHALDDAPAHQGSWRQHSILRALFLLSPAARTPLTSLEFLG
jgi:hypothetical protein